MGSGQGQLGNSSRRRLRQERGHHRWQGIEASRAESSHECFRRQSIKITKISTPVQDHRQTGGLELHQEADTVCSQVEQGQRLCRDRQRTRSSPHPLPT